MNSPLGMVNVIVTISLLVLSGQLAAQENQVLADKQLQEGTTDQTEAASPEQLAFQDEELAAMLILQHGKQHEISQFAAERAANEKVKQFAENVAREHGEFIRKLHGELLDETRQRVAGVLRDLAKQIRERQEVVAQRGSGERRVLGYRGTSDAAAAGSTTDSRADRSAIREQRQKVREERQDVGEARVGEDVREERAELREARGELRDMRRAAPQERREARARIFVLDVLPVVRGNLPQILDVIGQAVEEGSLAGNQKLALYKQCVDRHTETLKHELGSKQGNKFDEAYLHYEILAHLEMIDAMKTIRDYASSEFRATLDQALSMTEGHLQDARDLLSQTSEESPENEG